MQENYSLKQGIMSRRRFFSLPLLQDLWRPFSLPIHHAGSTTLGSSDWMSLVMQNFQSKEALVCNVQARTLFFFLAKKIPEYKTASSHPDCIPILVIRRQHRLDYLPLFGKWARAPARHERATEIEPSDNKAIRCEQNSLRVWLNTYLGVIKLVSKPCMV